MRGSIYSRQKCPKCDGNFVYMEKRGVLSCPNHPTQYAIGDYYVKFGRGLNKRFKSIQDAERFLTGIRYETDRGTFDVRDYRPSKPLAFQTLAEKWLEVQKRRVKDDQLSIATYRNYKRYIFSAIDVWGEMNIKTIGFGELEDFLLDQPVSGKTKANIKSCLHSFFNWVVHRERGRFQMPEFPEVKYNLGYRKVVSKATQEAIIEEVKRITKGINPKIWMGIKWLSTYISIRPKELTNLKEKEIDLQTGHFFIPVPKEKKFKIVPMLEEDIELAKSFPRGLPDLPFFRHPNGISGCKAGKQFGAKYFYKWWKKACHNLGIEGVDLYGGTKHSTATALREVLSPEQIMQGAKISTNSAFYRYLQMNDKDSLLVYEQSRNLTKNAPHPHHGFGTSET